RGEVARRGRVGADVVDELAEDVDQAAREGAHVRLDGEGQAHRVAGRGVGVLADDDDADVLERAGEGPQHVRPARQVAPPGGDLTAQEVTHGADLVLHGCQGTGPARVDELIQRSHGGQGNPRRDATARRMTPVWFAP